MTRSRTLLLLVLIALASFVVGRAAWAVLAPPVASALGTLPGLAASVARSVPEWVWWTAFSAVWWLPCALGKGRWGRGTWACPSRPASV